MDDVIIGLPTNMMNIRLERKVNREVSLEFVGGVTVFPFSVII